MNMNIIVFDENKSLLEKGKRDRKREGDIEKR